MQSAVSLFTVRDLRGSTLEPHGAFCAHAVLRADHRRSFAVYFCKSLRILGHVLHCEITLDSGTMEN